MTIDFLKYKLMINLCFIKSKQIYLNFITFSQFKNKIIRFITINNFNIILVIIHIKLKKNSINFMQINYFVTKNYRDLIQSWKWTKKMK